MSAEDLGCMTPVVNSTVTCVHFLNSSCTILIYRLVNLFIISQSNEAVGIEGTGSVVSSEVHRELSLSLQLAHKTPLPHLGVLGRLQIFALVFIVPHEV